LDAAAKCGLMDGQKGERTKADLSSGTEKEFRSAMAECKACWFFSSRCGLKTRFVSEQTDDGIKTPDLEVTLPDKKPLYVEVKAPLKEFDDSNGRFGFGGNERKLQNIMDKANRQFPEDTMNLLFIDSYLKSDPLYYDTRQLEIAFYGDHYFKWLLSNRGHVGEPQIGFKPTGKFLRPTKENRNPGFTRVGAVVVLESAVFDGDRRAEHLIAYNPFARNPLFPDYDELFKTDKKLIPKDGKMIWENTDC